MCGIWLQVIAANAEHPKQEHTNLSRRGPDHVGIVEFLHHGRQIELQASVLKMRSHSTLQPVSIPLRDNEELMMHLAWNGEVYQILGDESSSMETVAGYDVADTQLVADMWAKAHAKITESANEAFLEEFATSLANEVMGRLVNAEYAFCLVTPWAIYYGRDPWGKRSLLYWDDTLGSLKDSEELGDSDKPDHIDPSVWKVVSVAEKEVQGESTDTAKSNMMEVPPGIVHEYRFKSGQFHSTPIPKCNWMDPQPALPAAPELPENVSPSMWRASLELEHWLRQAVQLRVCGNTNPTTPDVPIPISVLFSGGIDSVVLAALALQVLPAEEPLRLWNVSFVDQHNTGAPTTAQDCLAAQASYEELLELFPNHTIHLETTEVSWEEITQWETHARTLIHPKTTTMDLNIAMALWFASRTRSDNAPQPHAAEQEPRILLVGMGADEQLGGYGRHRKAFERALKSTDDSGGTSHANESLRKELDLDIGRIWERNLGRDDRIFSDHGKEARFPYLDHHVTSFLAKTPLQDVCDYSLPPGQGDKRILRLMAMRLGLRTASGMVKRAIQFGSRIAHVSDKRRFGSRRKAKGTAAV